MVRHHSLILMLSFPWLEPLERERWATICGCAGKKAAAMLKLQPDPLAAIREWEEAGKRVMIATAAESCREEGAANLKNDERVLSNVKRYLLLTCFGIDVLIRRYSASDQPSAWIKEEIGKLSDQAYLEKDILDYIAVNAN